MKTSLLLLLTITNIVCWIFYGPVNTVSHKEPDIQPTHIFP